MFSIHNRCLNPAEVRRANALEIFDEFEEWQLIQVAPSPLSRGSKSLAPSASMPDPRVCRTALLVVQSRGLKSINYWARDCYW